MWDSIEGFFASGLFMPHGHCYLWLPQLVGLHVVADLLIGIAYLAISLTLYRLVRRVRLPFSPIFVAFGAFIFACGVTHFMEVWNIWQADYWSAGGVKAATAIASVATALGLLPLSPRVEAFARAAQLSEARRVELQTAHEELKGLYGRVKQLDAAKTDFFANVSHELRTPLALILGPAEKLLADAGMRADQRRDLGVIVRNARVLLKHVNDLLDVARVDAGRMPVVYSDVDLAALTRAAAANFETLAADRRIVLTVDAPERLPAQVDAAKLERVLLNLIGNAFKFVPDGGQVRCALTSDGARARLAVADSGPGVAPARRAAIFDRFAQGARGQGGTGLGLAIARELVGLHGGTIAVDAAPEGGALFAVELPLAAPAGIEVGPAPAPGTAALETLAELVSSPPAPPAAAAAAGASRVLLVEDNPDMARFVADALGGEHAVTLAREGGEALERALALPPDLIVTDVMMPGMGGPELVDRAQASAALRDIPILVLTAKADDALRVRLLERGASDYLAKPFATAELAARARNLVAMKRARDVLAHELTQRAGTVAELAAELVARKHESDAARAEAEQASQAKSSFLSLVSHELVTPLQAMLLNLDVTQRHADELPPKARQRFERVTRASRRLLDLIDSLLQYVRIESGRLELQHERVDLRGLAADIIEELRPQAQQKPLELSLEVAPDLPPLVSDPRLVRMVLHNLAVNAVKYTERGAVDVRIGHAGGRHQLTVADTGRGIAAQDLERIFEPFTQLGDVRHKHVPGVGLGLSLVRQVVTALGGSIAVASELGRGSEFTVSLPGAHARE